jgi:hypothetical protein
MVLIIKNESLSISVIGGSPVKKIIVKSLIIRIFVYSAMKIKANKLLLYSVLNPETNSDSPSAKSNGVRLVSARLVRNHVINNGRISSMVHDFELFDRSLMSIIWKTINAPSSVRAIDTSYEIVWATPRSAPNKEYFEFEHHPEIKVAYTFILDTHKKNNTPKFMKKAGCA